MHKIRGALGAVRAHDVDVQVMHTSVHVCEHMCVRLQAPEVQPLLDAGQKRQAASDVYAFGILLFELMTLQPVWKGFAKDVSEYEKKVRLHTHTHTHTHSGDLFERPAGPYCCALQ